MKKDRNLNDLNGRKVRLLKRELKKNWKFEWFEWWKGKFIIITLKCKNLNNRIIKLIRKNLKNLNVKVVNFCIKIF